MWKNTHHAHRHHLHYLHLETLNKLMIAINVTKINESISTLVLKY